MKIPRTFHWVWVGENPLPSESRAWIDGWLSAHPSWSQVIWTDRNRPPLDNEALYERTTVLSQRADILSFEVVLRQGGVYLDTDMECLRNLEALIGDCEAFVGEEEAGSVAHGIFGAVPGHPWLQDIVRRLPESVARHARIPDATGPGHMARVTEDHPEVTVFPPALFYPYGNYERSRAAGPFPDAYAVHHWHESWIPPEERFQEDFPLQVERELRALIPGAEPVITIAEGIELDLGDRPTIPFVGREGSWGNPHDSAAAACELDRLHGQGCEWLVVLEVAFWWLDHYADFFERVRNMAAEAHERHRFVAYRLRPATPAPPAPVPAT